MNECMSPCSDFLALFAFSAVLFVALIAYWSGRFDPTCRCPQRSKCSHRKGGSPR